MFRFIENLNINILFILYKIIYTKYKYKYLKMSNDKSKKRKGEDLEDLEDLEEELKKGIKGLELKKQKSEKNIIFNTYLNSPNIVNAANFFMIIDYDDLNYYDILFDYEKKLYMSKYKLNNETFNNDHLRDVYRIIAFKIDTIHDFTSSRSSNELYDLFYEAIEWSELTKKLKKPKNIEDTFLYWLLRHNKTVKYSNTVKTYITTSIENYIYTLRSKNIFYTMDASDSEKRISNFKNMLLFEKYFKPQTLCNDIKKTKNAYPNDIITIDDVVDNMVDENRTNNDFKIIFPQLFDANASTGKTIKFIDKIISQTIDKKDPQIEFKIIDDLVQMSIDNKNQINVSIQSNQEYPINTIIVLNDTNKFNNILSEVKLTNYLEKKFKYKNKILYCLNEGPGVNNLVQLYNILLNHYNNDKLNKINRYYELEKILKTKRRSLDENLYIQYSTEMIDIDLNKTLDELNKYKITLIQNISVIKRIGDYSQIVYCKYNNKKYTYISNDRMSSSFCYIENVNFIGQYKDCGILIDFMNLNMDKEDKEDKENELNNKLINVYDKLKITFPNFIQ